MNPIASQIDPIRATFHDTSLRKFFSYKQFAGSWGLLPLYGMMAGGLTMAGYFILHTAGGPEIAWTPKERLPYYEGYANNKLKREQTTKIYNPNGRFSERWNKFIS